MIKKQNPVLQQVLTGDPYNILTTSTDNLYCYDYGARFYDPIPAN